MNIVYPTLFPSLLPKVCVIYNFFSYPEFAREEQRSASEVIAGGQAVRKDKCRKLEYTFMGR